MHFSPKISEVEVVMLSAWRRLLSRSYTPYRTGVTRCISPGTLLLDLCASCARQQQATSKYWGADRGGSK